MSELAASLERVSHYSSGVEGSIQRGVVRVNCVDCLDRSNAVQSLVGLRVVARQLAGLGLDPQQHLARFQSSYKEMWLSNGNALSKLYAGTAAIRWARHLY